jgi:hypothetical protein
MIGIKSGSANPTVMAMYNAMQQQCPKVCMVTPGGHAVVGTRDV